MDATREEGIEDDGVTTYKQQATYAGGVPEFLLKAKRETEESSPPQLTNDSRRP